MHERLKSVLLNEHCGWKGQLRVVDGVLLRTLLTLLMFASGCSSCSDTEGSLDGAVDMRVPPSTFVDAEARDATLSCGDTVELLPIDVSAMPVSRRENLIATRTTEGLTLAWQNREPSTNSDQFDYTTVVANVRSPESPVVAPVGSVSPPRIPLFFLDSNDNLLLVSRAGTMASDRLFVTKIEDGALGDEASFDVATGFSQTSRAFVCDGSTSVLVSVGGADPDRDVGLVLATIGGVEDVVFSESNFSPSLRDTRLFGCVANPSGGVWALMLRASWEAPIVVELDASGRMRGEPIALGEGGLEHNYRAGFALRDGERALVFLFEEGGDPRASAFEVTPGRARFLSEQPLDVYPGAITILGAAERAGGDWVVAFQQQAGDVLFLSVMRFSGDDHFEAPVVISNLGCFSPMRRAVSFDRRVYLPLLCGYEDEPFFLRICEDE